MTRFAVREAAEPGRHTIALQGELDLVGVPDLDAWFRGSARRGRCM